ncbi:MAG: LPS export ABC transporter permease LptF [Alphaproteobacteria bacterium]|jgi:lipopolysaccharide export system permease protein|nr:LPS export ABC transporter permease LptF [Alphaproteobacteria bacterium]MBT4086453.1 LPS export ABC transporter permease LptF [Alphaproteobacteria bacterium]MBT4546433.1 LPS export ABC transporter permease LptF [Alphaproteobacteria bacterium]MBT7747672.1 LPS export ABC transporter permease LptF [Alphaproteobacteria bacterium]
MNGLNRYIFRQLMAPLVFITLVLTGVVWLTQSLRFVDMIVNRGLSAGEFLYVTLLLMPGVLVLILPIALFCAVLFAYHRLNYDSELVVMRSAGMSQRALVFPALVMAMVVVVISYVFVMYLTPLGFRTFKDSHDSVRSNYASVLIQEGVFNELMRGITVYVRARGDDGELLGILVHDNRDVLKPVTVMAERGLLLETRQGPRFVMENGNRQEIAKNSGQLSLLYFDKYALDLGRLASPGGKRWREPGERYMSELINLEDNNDDRKNANRMMAEVHKRISQPLHAFVLVLIALAGLLSGEFDRRGEWQRIAFVSCAALLFEISALALVPLVSKSPSLTPTMYLSILIAGAIAIWWLGRNARHLNRGRGNAPEPAA